MIRIQLPGPRPRELERQSPPSFSQGFPAFQCADPVDSVNCVQILNESAGDFIVVGSDVSGNGAAGESWSTQWEVAYTDPASKTFSFDWTYTGGDGQDSDESFYYYGPSGNLQSFILGSGEGDGGTVSVTLQQNWILGFGVATADNTGTAGKLVISGFDADPNPVPAPLPLLGAGAAFGWSRRLRSRIRRRAASVTVD